MRLSDIEKIFGGQVVRDCELDNLVLIGKYKKSLSNKVTFLQDEKFIEGFLTDADNIEGVICTEGVYEKIYEKYKGGVLLVELPKTVFFAFHNYLAINTSHYRSVMQSKIDESARIHETAIIAKENVIIGKNVIIEAYAIVNKNTTIEDEVIIRSHSIIGVPGFYYFEDKDKKTLVENVGGVTIKRNAEIHSNVTVETGVFGDDTIIGENTKIDNHILVGHDSILGTNCLLAAGTTLAGGVILEDNVFLGVGVTIAPYVIVQKNSKCSSGAVVTKNVPMNSHFSGNFAIEHKVFIENLKKNLLEE